MKSSYTLDEIVEALEKEELVMPPVQRGIVWNAARIELLWDSIMRQIPIGAISVRENKKKLEVWDGQQRTHAIRLALQKYDKKHDALVWLDVSPKRKLEDGGNNGQDLTRKFTFGVSTVAHPWGYRNDESGVDKENSKYSAGDIREIMEKFNKDYSWSNKGKSAARPRPDEMWPYHLKLPVLFSDLYAFVRNSKESDTDFDSFMKWSRGGYENEPNWVRNLRGKSKGKQPKAWDRIIKAVRGLKEYQVPILNVSNVAPGDQAVYFERMNRAGEPPSPEDIQYSMLKMAIPELKEHMEKYLENEFKYLPPAKWARLAMLLFRSEREPETRGGRWKVAASVSDREVLRLSKDSRFRDFVRGDGKKTFKSILGKVDDLLIGGKDKKDGLLPWHRTRLLQRGDSLSVFVLQSAEDPKFNHALYPGLIMLLNLYAEDMSSAVECLMDAKEIQEGVFRAIRQGALRIPILPFELENLVDNGKGHWEKRFEKIYASLTKRLGDVADGFTSKKGGVDLLIYACRKYIKDTFGDYDTGALEWQEQNCPWDYDHILPRAWVDGMKHSKNQKRFIDVCKMMLQSIGNSAPIPLSLNRSKSDSAPGVYYPDGTACSSDGLHVDVEAIEQYAKGENSFVSDSNEGNVKHFVKTTAERLHGLYQNMYDGLKWSKILPLGQVRDARKERLMEIRKKFPQACISTQHDGVEEDLAGDEKSLFWASPELHIGLKSKPGDKVRVFYWEDVDSDEHKDMGHICICRLVGQNWIVEKIRQKLWNENSFEQKGYSLDVDEERGVYLEKMLYDDNVNPANIVEQLKWVVRKLKETKLLAVT